MTAMREPRGRGEQPPAIESIVELASVWYWETDADHRYTAIVAPQHDRDRPISRYIGCPRWDLPGAVALNTTWEAHRAMLDAHLPFRDLQYFVEPPGHAARYVASSGEPVFKADGAFVGYRGTSRDITQQWLAGQRLGEAEALLKLAAKLSRMGAWSAEAATGQLTWSEEISDGPKLARWKTAAMSDMLAIFAPESRQRLEAAFRECAANGTPFELEAQAVVDGEPRWIGLSGVAARDAAGAIVRVQGAFQDVTVSKTASERHRLAAQRLAHTLDSLPFGFGTVDGEWRITFANPMAEHILGRSRESLLGLRLWDALPGLEDTPFGECYKRAMSQRTLEEFEGHYAPLDIWTRVRAFPFEDGIAITFSDVTKAWQAQQEVARLNQELEQRVTRRTAQLEAASKDLEAFAYTVAHDLRAPLAAIAGYSKALAQSAEQQLGTRSAHYVDRIQAAAQRLDAMTDAILSLSKLNRVQLRQRPVDLAEVARHCIAMLQESEPQRRVDWRVPASLPAQGDPALLQVVMNNLLANAWKYTGQRVHPVIEVGSEGGADNETVYFVRDNGIGFDPAEATRLFEPFCRLHDAAFEGTGIGLATVHRLVTRHGGRVWASAAPNAGATFHFTLPAPSGKA
jgi:PAS domain S-box-containing protein